MTTEISNYIDEFIKKNPWIMSRLWDDNCTCKTEDTILPTCKRHGKDYKCDVD